MKNCLRKSSSRFTKTHLDEITFTINSTASHEGTGSENECLFGRSIISVNPDIEIAELINRRIEKHDNRIKGKNKTNKILYQVGERVRLQNVANKEWVLKGTIDQMTEGWFLMILSQTRDI